MILYNAMLILMLTYNTMHQLLIMDTSVHVNYMLYHHLILYNNIIPLINLFHLFISCVSI